MNYITRIKKWYMDRYIDYLPDVVADTSMLSKMFDSEGVPYKPFTIRCHAKDLDYITSMNGVTVCCGTTLHGLNNVSTLDGCTSKPGTELYDMTSLTSIGNCIFIVGDVNIQIHDLKMLEVIDLNGACTNVLLGGLSAVTDLSNITLPALTILEGLVNVTNIDGLTTGSDCSLRNLETLTKINKVNLGSCTGLDGMTNIVVRPDPTPAELDILRQIPINELHMTFWHCSTGHCLAGWAQVLTGLRESTKTAFEDGCRLLPSMQPYFLCTDRQVIDYLKTLH